MLTKVSKTKETDPHAYARACTQARTQAIQQKTFPNWPSASGGNSYPPKVPWFAKDKAFATAREPKADREQDLQ